MWREIRIGIKLAFWIVGVALAIFFVISWMMFLSEREYAIDSACERLRTPTAKCIQRLERRK